MTARYIPPNRRKVENTDGLEKGNTDLAPSTDKANEARRPIQQTFRLSDIVNYFDADSSSTTLHATKGSPGKLGLVLLFHGANPRWATDRIIYAKSNLHLVESYTDGAGTSEAILAPTPIAVFEQTRNHGTLEFQGWHTITRLQLLEPRSEDLVRMLEQKWQKTDRCGNMKPIERQSSAWQKSLSTRWAVVKFEVDEVANREKGVPDIKVTGMDDHAEGGEPKSVNELLQEMRLRDAAESNKKNVGPLTEQDFNVSSMSGHSTFALTTANSAAEPAADVESANEPATGASTAEI